MGFFYNCEGFGLFNSKISERLILNENPRYHLYYRRKFFFWVKFDLIYYVVQLFSPLILYALRHNISSIA